MEKQTEYISDGNSNYLRINYSGEGKTSYSYRMIMENTIKGLIPCRVRTIDGDTYLYYEIQSKQTLQSRYEMKEMNYEALKNLFFQVCMLGKELKKYLLDLKDIVFNEKYIFQNIETGETGFIFLPNKKAKEDTFAEFMEYIVKRIDHRDGKAVQISYRLYDLSRNGFISVKEIGELFEDQERIGKKTEKNIGKGIKRNIEKSIGDISSSISAADQEILIEDKDSKKEDCIKSMDDRSLLQVGEYEEWEGLTDRNGQTENAKWRDILISCVLIIGFTILLCVKISVRLTYEEETMILAGMAVDLAAFFIHICYKVWNRRKDSMGRSDRETNAGEENSENVENNLERNNSEKLRRTKENGYDNSERMCGTKEKRYDMAERVCGTKGKGYDIEEKEMESEADDEEEKNTYGETVFLEPETENILYGLGKYERIIIQINKFPFTIGKLKDEADYILKDSSVSRVHARFYQNQKEVYIMDLNSTNGTYKNGFRIPANQKVLIEEGDEITFGKIRFHYR